MMARIAKMVAANLRIRPWQDQGIERRGGKAKDFEPKSLREMGVWMDEAAEVEWVREVEVCGFILT